MTAEKKEMKFPIYSTFTYPDDHFSLSNGSAGEDWFVAALRYKKGPHYLVKVNTHDAKGLRVIVRLITLNSSDMPSTLNRPYTLQEKQGLCHVSALVAHIYEICFGLVAQVEILGNNAHDMKDGKVILGKLAEPVMLHAHVFGRGDPEHAYIAELPDLKLGGPPPGQLFLGTAKVKWPSSEHVKIFATILASHIRQLMSETSITDMELVSLGSKL